MRAKVLTEGEERTFVLIFDQGETVIAPLMAFAKKHRLTGSRLSGIGALSQVTLGYFDLTQKTYVEIPLHEQVEVLSLVGNLALHHGDHKVHAHIVVGKRDGTAHGGHLLEATVNPTLEIMLIESPSYLQRQFDPAIGLALLTVE
jgi:predicted DNA-binding protein with PD1-like motif